jgi:hypothetical protein
MRETQGQGQSDRNGGVSFDGMYFDMRTAHTPIVGGGAGYQRERIASPWSRDGGMLGRYRRWLSE